MADQGGSWGRDTLPGVKKANIVRLRPLGLQDVDFGAQLADDLGVPASSRLAAGSLRLPDPVADASGGGAQLLVIRGEARNAFAAGTTRSLPVVSRRTSS